MWFLRFLANWLGGMVAATGVVLVYVYVAGAPHLPRLPIIGLPETYVALALLLAWAVAQLYVSLLGTLSDGLLFIIGWRRSPTTAMAFGHGMLATAALLLLAWHYEPTAATLRVVLLVPLGVQAGVRLIAGRVPDRGR